MSQVRTITFEVNTAQMFDTAANAGGLTTIGERLAGVLLGGGSSPIDQLEALRSHAEAMAKVMARIGRAEQCHCARCTAMGEDARLSLAAFRAAFPEVG